ncbi:membrane protein [Jannaschia pagri]|uniref:Membrane protein n=1 Tax=Jannaschia pagri TaxID=2829797 RepID=A0ABQ4NNT9_9RHOB|nr:MULTISPECIES: YitT family protein [unclassified Jannaschia]GIT92249.1 membrane protein [Jannaschia sp. AI_61]GIT96083.1 membrane protein [Jannaschia sp. AI_62]
MAQDTEPHRALAHTPLEDAQAFVLGTVLCALGVHFLTSDGLITGQTAGLAVLLSYLSPLSFAVWFFVVNLPFYVLGWMRMGPRFVVKTGIAVTLVSVLSTLLPGWITLDSVSPWLSATLAGAVTGMGLIVIFRHGASLGGIGILALWLQERLGVQAGWVQLGFDGVLFVIAGAVLDLWLVAASLLGAAIVNIIVAVNHRRDRYVGR